MTEAHVEARRQQILAATVRCLARKGFKSTTLKDICREAQLSMGAIYSYFKSKGEIVVALGEAGRKRSLALGGPRPAGATTRGWLSEILRRIASVPQADEASRIDLRLWAEALDTPLLQEQLRLSYGSLLDAVEGLVREGQERGEIPGALNPTEVARLFHSLHLGLAVQRAFDPDLDSASYVEAATAFLEGRLNVPKGDREPAG